VLGHSIAMVPALSFWTIEQSEYLKYDSNQYLEKWCEMENMKFMETDEDNGSKIRGFSYTIVTILRQGTVA
jgi:hypothetical protein